MSELRTWIVAISGLLLALGTLFTGWAALQTIPPKLAPAAPSSNWRRLKGYLGEIALACFSVIIIAYVANINAPATNASIGAIAFGLFGLHLSVAVILLKGIMLHRISPTEQMLVELLGKSRKTDPTPPPESPTRN